MYLDHYLKIFVYFLLRIFHVAVVVCPTTITATTVPLRIYFRDSNFADCNCGGKETKTSRPTTGHRSNTSQPASHSHTNESNRPKTARSSWTHTHKHIVAACDIYINNTQTQVCLYVGICVYKFIGRWWQKFIFTKNQVNICTFYYKQTMRETSTRTHTRTWTYIYSHFIIFIITNAWSRKICGCWVTYI